MKQLKSLAVAITLVGSAIAAPSAWSHHGWSWYGNQDFTLTATVVETRFGNPHDQLVLEDAEGQRWNALLSPPGRSRSAGLTADKVKVGDTVTAFGHRRSEGDNFEMKTERLQVGDQVYDLYPNRS